MQYHLDQQIVSNNRQGLTPVTALRSINMKLKRILKWTLATSALLLLGGFAVAYVRSTNACAEKDRPAPKTPMTAVVYCEYGGPHEVLRLEQVEKPVPGDSQVLVRVRAAAANPLDWHYLRGTPYIARALDMGLRKPKVIRLGADFAGVVEAVGPAVTQFKPGDEVFGARTGAFSQYVTIRESALVHRPANVTWEESAALPVAGLTALQGLRRGGVTRGTKVLINGASGGVGTFAVQIAHALGAEVTGVQSTRNLELVKSLGADHVIDYTKEDFTQGSRKYDVIIDNVGNHSLSDLRRVLEPRGKLVIIGGSNGRWFDPLPRVLGAMIMSWFVSQDLGFMLSRVSQKDLVELRDMVQAGTIKPVIDRRYRLHEIAQALAYLETGRARGKVVIEVD